MIRTSSVHAPALRPLADVGHVVLLRLIQINTCPAPDH